MSKLGPIGWRDLVGRLRALGFEGPYQEGKDPFMVRGTLRLCIPNPHSREISAGLLSRILRSGQVSREEWESTG